MPRKPCQTLVHVNKHIIRANRVKGRNDPVLTVKHRGKLSHGHEAAVLDENGNEVGRFIYRPEQPLSCGAEVWFKTSLQVVPLQRGSHEPPTVATVPT